MAALITTFLGFVSLSNSISLPINSIRTPGVVQLRVAQRTNNETLSNTIGSLSKRQDLDPIANTQTGTLYLISLTIGTPPQSVSVQIDTGSSDLWVNPTCANSGSSSSIAMCDSYPDYVPSKSSTAENTGNAMSLEYGKGACDGEYYTDTVSVGAVTLLQQQFGVASTSSDLSVGIMGISWGIDLGTGYYNIIDQLAAQGHTASRAFSLDLGNVDTSQGSIIFGGIDTMKYYGALEKRPIIPYWEAPDGTPRYWIYMSSIGITTPGSSSSKLYTSSNYSQAVFLDSGGTLSLLPTNIVNAIVADFPGASYQGNGLYLVPCSYLSMAGTVDFGFGNTVIKVPYHQFIWEAGTNVCVLGVVATTGPQWVLGDTFLRAAFVVYDQDNANLLLANAAYCGSNLVPIGKGTDAVPSITGACSAPPSSTSSSSSKTSTSSSSSKTSTSSSSSKTSTSSSSSKTSTSSSSSKTSTSSSSSKTSTSSSSSKTSTSSSSSKTSTSSSSSKTSTSSSSKTTPASSTSTKSTSSSKVSSTSTSSLKPSSTSSTKTSSSTTQTTSSKSSSSSKSTSSPSSSISRSVTTTSKVSSTSTSTKQSVSPQVLAVQLGEIKTSSKSSSTSKRSSRATSTTSSRSTTSSKHSSTTSTTKRTTSSTSTRKTTTL